MHVEKKGLPFVITQELFLDDFFSNLMQHPPTTEGWRIRIKLWLMALVGQVRGFTFKTDEGVKVKGWIHTKTAQVFVTQIKF